MSRKPPHFLVFQHIVCEHPGTFRDYFAEDGVTWDAIELDEGEAIPELSAYDGLVVMGGPMDVWEEDTHPWLVAEKAAIAHAVGDLKMPYLGLCLGHQLLADAMGGAAGPASAAEIGVLEVTKTRAGRASPFLSGMADTMPCLQWHSAEVAKAPSGAEILATSPACAVQAMSIGTHAFSMQYHCEIDETTVPMWGSIPEYAAALEKTAGAGALAAFDAAARQKMDTFRADSRRIYQNFMTTTGLL